MPEPQSMQDYIQQRALRNTTFSEPEATNEAWKQALYGTVQEKETLSQDDYQRYYAALGKALYTLAKVLPLDIVQWHKGDITPKRLASLAYTLHLASGICRTTADIASIAEETENVYFPDEQVENKTPQERIDELDSMLDSLIGGDV